MAGGDYLQPKRENVYAFCDDDLLSTSFSQFEAMRNNFKLCDVTLKAGDRYFQAHRIVLAIRIPYFQKVFTCDGGTENKIKEIAFDEVCPDAVESLINFAYTSRVKITNGNVKNLFAVSSKFQVDSIKNACVDFLRKGTNLDNVLDIRCFWESQGYYDLVKNSDSYICENFLPFSNTENFINLPYCCLRKLIASDCINVFKEEEIYEAVLKWAKADHERHALLHELLKDVRLQVLHVDYLIEHVCTEPLIQACVYCKGMVDEAKNYHLLSRLSAFSSLNNSPRQYRTVKTPALERSHDLPEGRAAQEYQSSEIIYALCYSQSLGVCCYDSQNKKWLKVTETGCTNFGCVTSAKNDIYIFGENAIEIFHTRNLQWKRLETIQNSFLGAGIAPHGSKFYCFGGCSEFSRKVRCFGFEQELWFKEGKMSFGRSFPAVAVAEGLIYVTGGHEDATVFDAVEAYDPATEKFSDVSPMLTKRWWHGSTTVDTKIYVCGGCNHLAVYLNTAEMYDPKIDRWTSLSPMSKGLVFLSLVSHSSKVYAIGGMLDDDKYTDAVEVYDPERNEWKTEAAVCSQVEPDVLVKAVSVFTESKEL